MGITNQLTLQSFLAGYLISMGGLVLFRPKTRVVTWKKLPGQMVALVYYLFLLYRDILLSGIDLAQRVLSPDTRLRLGIIAVPVQDPENSPLVAALSADVISLTPGELVVEIEENRVMYVHVLDLEDAEANATPNQARRLELLHRILGR